jgi:hypothetical protein
MRIPAVLIFIATIGSTACGSSEQHQISTAASDTVISVTVSGPASLAPGGTAAFSATGRTVSGSVVDVTSKVFWTTSDGTVLSISSLGQVTARKSGETQVVAAVTSTLSARMTVLVLPAGTYRLTGTVTDGGVPLPVATVSVVSGTGSGLSAITATDGTYRLYGVAGDIQLQVNAPGYVTSTQSLSIAANGVNDFSVTPTGGKPNLTGTYSMTVSANASCAPPGSALYTLPGDVRERHYIATISQMGAKFQVTLSGADFVLKLGRGNSFSGTVLGPSIQFRVNDGYYYGPYPDILESLGPNRYVLINGLGTLTLAGTDLTGAIDGTYVLVNSADALWVSGSVIGSCYSQAGHPVALIRQTSTTRIR